MGSNSELKIHDIAVEIEHLRIGIKTYLLMNRPVVIVTVLIKSLTFVQQNPLTI